MIIAPEASTTSQSDASMDGATSAISSSSMSTSPPGISPTSGSIEMMWPPRSSVRADIFVLTFLWCDYWCGPLVPSSYARQADLPICLMWRAALAKSNGRLCIVSSARSGHRRLERYIELAGVERSAQASPRHFLLVLVPGQRPDEGRFDRSYRVVLQVRIIREEYLRDERLVSFRLHLEMYVRRTPRVLTGGFEHRSYRPGRRDRVRPGHHRLKLVAALVVAEPPPEVVVRLSLVPDVVAAIGTRLPDIEHCVAYGGAVCRGDPALDEEYIPVLHAFVLLVNFHRLLPPGRALTIERPFHVARRSLGLALVGDGIH